MRRALVLAALAGSITAAVVACTLNPQPLPPADFASANDDASTHADGGSFGGETPGPNADAATDLDGGRQLDDGGDASNDGGDASDASDASTDGG